MQATSFTPLTPAVRPPNASGGACFPKVVQHAPPDFDPSSQPSETKELTASRLITSHTRTRCAPGPPIPTPLSDVGVRPSRPAVNMECMIDPYSRRLSGAILSALLLFAGLPCAAEAGIAVQISAERRLSFNDGWRFFKGEAQGAERPDFQDSQWAPTPLPHDWAIEGPFDQQAQPPHRSPAHLRDRLVPQILHPPRRRQGPLLLHRVRWRHVQCARVD